MEEGEEGLHNHHHREEEDLREREREREMKYYLSGINVQADI